MYTTPQSEALSLHTIGYRKEQLTPTWASQTYEPLLTQTELPVVGSARRNKMGPKW